MVDSKKLVDVFKSISDVMGENRDYLIALDQQNGDGDLGISMDDGYRAVYGALCKNSETDLGKTLFSLGKVFNEAAPSSLGTITAFGLMGMGKALKGKSEATLSEVADAMDAGARNIMAKAGSKEGEKTILDSLMPGIRALQENASADVLTACEEAYKSAEEGSEKTRGMLSVHGRAAYYGEKSIGVLDGGSVVGKLIFQGILNYVKG